MFLVYNFKLFQLKQNKGWTVVGKDFIWGKSEMALSVALDLLDLAAQVRSVFRFCDCLQFNGARE